MTKPSARMSQDSGRRVNYGQWRSKEEFEAKFRNAQAAIEHMKAITAIASPDAHLYEANEVHGG
jgi:hypothetical protein